MVLREKAAGPDLDELQTQLVHPLSRFLKRPADEDRGKSPEIHKSLQKERVAAFG